MKYVSIMILLSACGMTAEQDFAAHLEAERDFAMHQYHVQQSTEKQYDPEYVDDCYYYKDLICEFE